VCFIISINLIPNHYFYTYVHALKLVAQWNWITPKRKQHLFIVEHSSQTMYSKFTKPLINLYDKPSQTMEPKRKRLALSFHLQCIKNAIFI
jgi:hypothetical protein